MGSSSLRRIIKLLNLLQSGHAASSRNLATALGCSRRSVFRYIRLLNESGISVLFDGVRREYVLGEPVPLPTTGLEDEEFAALLIAASVSPLARVDGFAEDVNQCIAKLMAKAREPVRKKVKTLLKSIIFETRALNHTESQKRVLETIICALHEHQHLRIYHHVNGNGDVHCTKIAPHVIIMCDNSWKVVARSSVHRKVVQFDLTNIEKVEPIKDHCPAPVRYSRSGQNGSHNPTAPQVLACASTVPSASEQ